MIYWVLGSRLKCKNFLSIKELLKKFTGWKNIVVLQSTKNTVGNDLLCFGLILCVFLKTYSYLVCLYF